MKNVTTLFLLLLSFVLGAQSSLPDDYLPSSFHADRREALRKQMPTGSVAVFFANPERNRSNDVDYVYHQDPDFYYLTGYKEPNAALLVFSENQKDENGNTYNEVLFVQEKNKQAEQWNGYRLGVEGAKQKLGFSKVYNGIEFHDFPIDYNSFSQVFFHGFHDDYRDSKRNQADLFSLIAAFKNKVNFADYKPPHQAQQNLYGLIKATEVENSANVAQTIDRYLMRFPELKEDELLTSYAKADIATRKELKQKVSLKLEKSSSSIINLQELGKMMATLREVKTAEELKLLNKAIQISAIGQVEVMKAMHPGMSEREIQGIHEFVFKKYGAEYEGYPSIVGGGHNGCVLHYIDNSKTKVGNDLVLMDLGAEYHGYTADVTRTIPANGTFTKEQKEIYDLVYRAQEAGIAAAKVGNAFGATDQAAREVINKGLVALGIVKSEAEARQYFPHGTSHYIGLDVHDAGNYGPLQENMVITVEPGIYIPENSDCDSKWWGIAVRIEDCILVTKNGPENLSAGAPRTSEAIEKTMKESSVLNDFVLPTID
ncbi:aminopeptidase P family protein [Imtechella halotolerans]|uniref:Xaa-Pro aminopeptidase n=1 Tax=Imtechella halotolerans K1 TaxID=946077 RepID=I0WG41_9FLAO|nr:aminopeptidase P family protein [Imtechella halotolerans]EID75357.1 Xaa-Pro aminopeptidase, family M24 [Imtechella halotolerans K1]WMQ63731.1 aminopeptidase P family protein [Imtechella halotolerans]